jgi:hypothetical protein
VPTGGIAELVGSASPTELITLGDGSKNEPLMFLSTTADSS